MDHILNLMSSGPTWQAPQTQRLKLNTQDGLNIKFLTKSRSGVVVTFFACSFLDKG